MINKNIKAVRTFKSAKRESYFFCLKKYFFKFHGGVIIEKLGPNQFLKNGSKSEIFPRQRRQIPQNVD